MSDIPDMFWIFFSGSRTEQTIPHKTELSGGRFEIVNKIKPHRFFAPLFLLGAFLPDRNFPWQKKNPRFSGFFHFLSSLNS